MPSVFKEGMRYRDIKQVMVTWILHLGVGYKNSSHSTSLAYLPSYWSSEESVDVVPERQVVSSQVKVMR